MSSVEVQKVQKVMPTPPKFDQPLAGQINIKKLISQVTKQVTESVVRQLTRMSPSHDKDDSAIQRALATVRKMEPEPDPEDTVMISKLYFMQRR